MVLMTLLKQDIPFLSILESDILPPILKVLHDPRPQLKSSALSLITEIAQTSPFALIPFIHQLVDFIHHIFLLEKTPETRRGKEEEEGTDGGGCCFFYGRRQQQLKYINYQNSFNRCCCCYLIHNSRIRS